MRFAKSILAATTALSLVALTACERRSEQVSEQRSGEEEEQVIGQEATTTESGELGGQTAERGKAEVTGRETVTKKESTEVERKVPTVVTGTEKADINRMKKEDFVALGLESNIAEKVIQYREDRGQFRAVDDLGQVPGMNRQWLSENKSKLGVASGVGGEEQENQQQEQQQPEQQPQQEQSQ